MHALGLLAFGPAILIAASAFGDGQAETPALVVLVLPDQAEISVPPDWSFFDPQIEQAISQTKAGEIDLHNIQPQDPMAAEALVRANSPPDGSYASMSLKFFSEKEDLQVIKSALSGDVHLKRIADYQENETKKILGPDQAFIERISIRPLILTGGCPGFVFIYRRQGLNGPVHVETMTVFRSDGYFVLQVAYREAEEARWKGLTRSIQVSLTVQ